MANRIYTKTEESGFGDPFIGNDDNFDILQYVGQSDTPEGSPVAFCGANNVIYQQQQQLLNVAATELMQALQAPGPMPHPHQQLHKNPNLNPNNHQQLENVGGLIVYSNNNNEPGIAQKVAGQLGVGSMLGRARIPDNSPITDFSAGGGSISPGSSGGSSSSYSPDQYQHYPNHPTANGLRMVANGGLQQMHARDDISLVNQMGQMMGQRGGAGLIHRGSSGEGTECMHSPNSEFLSPYPPSQSTPGSQHSSQVSPPAISHHRGGINYLHSQLANAPFASMDNLYAASNNQLQGSGEPEMCQQQRRQPVFSQPQGQKRRRMSSSGALGSNESLPLSTINNNNGNLPNIKSELGTTTQGHPQTEQRTLSQQAQQQSFEDLDENSNSQRTIKFEPYMRDAWTQLYDINQQPLPTMPVAVVADKGFNYSASDNCFVNQKKNHFQITVNIAIDPSAASNPTSSSASPTLSLNGHSQPPPNPFTPYFVRVHGTLQPIINNEFYLGFCGVKNEMQTSEIKIKQSQADRKPIDHDPEGFKLDGSRPSVRQTVARLHFGETTMNNHRKNGKPNPEQKFFLLVVRLLVKTPVGPVLVQAYHSDRVIVRASNPGQFEQPDQELNWQRGQNGSLAFPGQICIGTEKPIGDAHLTVHGNIATTGNVTRPSDRRVKEDIADLSTTEAMARVAQMRLVEYAYKPEIAQQWGLSEQDRHRVGVIAQELAEVLPDAVKDNGEFLTVDDTRVFYDTVAAAQELYRLTGNLEGKIEQVEKISQKLARYAQKRKQLGSMASGLSDFSTLFGAKNGLPSKQSCVSYSRTSLTTTGTSNNNNIDDDEEGNKARKRSGKGRDERMNHYRCRSYSSASAYCNRSYYGGTPNSALCNSKFTQGTIVALVVIMALCLVTMCTLYVLDWYNRTYVLMHGLHPAHSMASKVPSGPEKLIEKKWDLPKEQNVPPLSVFCSSIASLLPVPFASCPQYCCPNNGDKIGAAVDSLIAAGSKTVGSIFPPPPQEFFKDARLVHNSNNLINGIKIEMLNLNVTIGSHYCTDKSCDAKNGDFDLYVPIAENLPTMPLQLRFSVDDPTLFVDGCGSLEGFPYSICQFGTSGSQFEEEAEKKQPSSNKVTENIYEISAGSFLKSGYSFRVGHSTNLCQQDKRQRGRLFDEYNLIFYRTCATKLENVPEEEQGAAQK